MRWLVLPLLLASCKPDGPDPGLCADLEPVDCDLPWTGEGLDPCVAPTEREELDEPQLMSPAPGFVTHAPWIPIRVDLPWNNDGAIVTTCLDDQPAIDPLGLTRERLTDNHWKGWDYLGALPLADVEAGEHTLRVFFDRGNGTQHVVTSVFTIDRTGHRITVNTADEDGTPMPARVVVLDDSQMYTDLGSPDRESWDWRGRDEAVHSLFATHGTTAIDLPAGRYTLLATRGIRHAVATSEVQLTADTTVELVLAEQVPMPDHMAADLHVHTGKSYDSYVPDRIRWESIATSGLDIAVVTDHNTVVQGGPAVEALDLGDAYPLYAVDGIEADMKDPGGATGSLQDIGHLNAFPVVPESEGGFPRARLETGADHIDAHRQRQHEHPHPETGTELVLQLNHPRGIHFWPTAEPIYGAWPYFRENGFDPTVPIGEFPNDWANVANEETGTTPLDWDALEVVNRFSMPLYRLVRDDWFALLDQGQLMAGTGNSDSHALQVEVAGLPTNLVEMRRPAAGEPLDQQAFIDAIRDRRVLVSSGPVVTLEVEGSGASRQAVVRVRAPDWVPVPEVRLVHDGDVVELVELDHQEGTVLDQSFTFDVDFETDGWLVAEAGWPLDSDEQPQVGGTYELVAPGYFPVGFTNPVLVDVDGDGWEAPGL